MLLMMVAVALAGCAGMDADECRAADWRAIGYEDGIQGQSAAAFGARRKACAGHGITADFDGYLAGRGEGLAHYCRPQNGYNLGAQGHRYAGVCPAGQEEVFLEAYAEGYGLYERSAEVDRIGKSLRRHEKRLSEIDYLLAERTTLLIAPDLETGERAALVVELGQLTEERVELERAIDQLGQDYAAAELEYEAYRRSIAARPGS